MGAAGLPHQRAPGSEADEDGAVEPALSQPEGSAAGTAGEAEGTSLHPCALRLSAVDGAAAPPRLEGERQTHLSSVHGRGFDSPDQAAQEDSAPAARDGARG